MALAGDAVADLSQEIEFRINPGARAAVQAPVFVAGLARAGTTLLMRLLHETGEFASLTYRDMPFPMAPSLWGRLNALSMKRGELAERAHGDGLLVDFDSPEALEEVFWRVHCARDYLSSGHLRPMAVTADVARKFRRYVGCICHHHGRPRYLSKNNNNILRLAGLKQAFPDAVLLAPFREPVQQAWSLLSQHRRFSELHAQDRFARDYMGWLVHHEFGGDHRPFLWPNGQTATASPEQLDYWLTQWLNTYGALLRMQSDQPSLGLGFVSYERLCARPREVWQSLAARAALTASELRDPGQLHAPRTLPAAAQVDPVLLRRAGEIHAELQRKAI